MKCLFEWLYDIMVLKWNITHRESHDLTSNIFDLAANWHFPVIYTVNLTQELSNIPAVLSTYTDYGTQDAMNPKVTEQHEQIRMRLIASEALPTV